MSRRGSRNACIGWGWAVVEDEDEGGLIRWSEGTRRWSGIIDCTKFSNYFLVYQNKNSDRPLATIKIEDTSAQHAAPTAQT